ncbi:uncharacterized protein LOC110032231, partial [Phalaenopsis equestris]|uniref:uncharacterized protein LOC110032231 n=1 Tax=Phalaenopsis equestris TaxID=78828 RepID=UPI0009E52CD0
MARNEVKHNNGKAIFSSVFSNILPYSLIVFKFCGMKGSFYSDINYFGSLGHSTPGRMTLSHLPTLVRWRPPSLGMVKINTDGSWSCGGAVFGGVARNDKGYCILYIASPCYDDSALQAEAHTILMVVNIVILLNWHNLQIETDSKILYEILNLGMQVSWDISYFINRINRVPSSITIACSFIHRKGNRSANLAAKLGDTTPSIIVGTVPPPPLKVLIDGDSLDASYVRK